MSEPTPVDAARARLRVELTRAMRARDRVTVAALLPHLDRLP